MSAIPRLLLLLLRRPLLLRPPLLPSTLRSASSKPPVLSKPTKFTPPSHPSSRPLPRDPINYPGPPTPARDPARRYPNTMPPPNTWAHTLLTSRVLHFYISMGILLGLAGIVSVTNFLRTSRFAGDVFWDPWRPVASARSVLVAVREHVEEESRRVGAQRKKKVEDVDLRGEYRRAHGLEKRGKEGGFGGWAVKLVGGGSGGGSGGGGGGGGGEAGVEALEDWVVVQLKEVEAEAASEAASEAKKAAAAAEVVPEKKKKSSGWW